MRRRLLNADPHGRLRSRTSRCTGADGRRCGVDPEAAGVPNVDQMKLQIDEGWGFETAEVYDVDGAWRATCQVFSPDLEVSPRRRAQLSIEDGEVGVDNSGDVGKF